MIELLILPGFTTNVNCSEKWVSMSCVISTFQVGLVSSCWSWPLVCKLGDTLQTRLGYKIYIFGCCDQGGNGGGDTYLSCWEYQIKQNKIKSFILSLAQQIYTIVFSVGTNVITNKLHRERIPEKQRLSCWFALKIT